MLESIKSTNTNIKILGITTGDTDGIGLEVTLKALKKVKIPINFRVHVYYNSKQSRLFLKEINQFKNKRNIFFIDRNDSPAQWVEDVAKYCSVGDYCAMVTAPLSKQTIHNAGFKDMGHTGILSRVSKQKNLKMCFLGKYFNVLLLTDHIPLQKVSSTLTPAKFIQSVLMAKDLLRLLPPKRRNLPMAWIGLNPHAGENGLIGNCEIKIKKKLNIIAKKTKFIGPLSPDAAFLKKNWNKFSFYLASYHDQGLIPFKMVHGSESGVHVTGGLPFIRTSVDHGTAKDIYTKKIANPNSMREAIRIAIKLATARSK